jgi:hypothetical protein
MGNPVFSQSSNQTLFWLIHQSNLIHSGVGLFSDYVQDVLILKSIDKRLKMVILYFVSPMNLQSHTIY